MSDKRRRKSLSIFRPALSSLTVPSTTVPSADEPAVLKKKIRPGSASLSTPASPSSSSPNPDSALSEKFEHSGSPIIRPRATHKSSASRASVFGSLRSLRSLEDEEKLTMIDSKASSFNDDDEKPLNVQGLFGNTVLHHGEVQTVGGMFRKKSQYLVLTETHLIRFKTQAKAAEMYPTIPASLGRSNTSRSSIVSIASYHDVQMATYSEITLGVALNQIIATYMLDDGRPYFSVEVSHLDDRSKRASSMHMQLGEPREAELWLSAIRTAATKARSKHATYFQPDTLEYVARALERDRDYDPQHFQVFRVVQRASHRSTGRSSSDDLAKVNSTICYLACGINKVHLIQLHKSPTRSSSSALHDIESPVSFGIMTLAGVNLHTGEDSFQLTFRAPLRSNFVLHLASSAAREIVLWIRSAAEYLRPEWPRQPFAFIVPRQLEDQINHSDYVEEDHQCFDRTLIAYCAAYDLDTSRICYTIDYACEDAPRFQLLPPTRAEYTALELLAVMRSLRYNESFASISFSGINLSPLRALYDLYGVDQDGHCTRSGAATNLAGHQDLPLLSQEIRALALKSKRLRRLDFSHSLPKIPQSENGEQQGCGIPEALVPLCKKSFTNVDWIILSGIKLGDSDVDYLVDAASERACHLRALEIGNCGLSVHDMDVLLSTMAVQESTMEVIDISGCQGRFSPELFQRQIGFFGHIRRIDLTRVQKTAGPEPLIAPETLLTWRLEALYLSYTAINDQTVDSISSYLASPRSDTLRELHLDQCGLSGKDLAVFFHAMTRTQGVGRTMHVSASENRLKVGYSSLFESIGRGMGPTHLTTRMVEFEKEHHFRQLVQALTKNTTLKSLDISKASLPYDAGTETCEALQKMFEENRTLEELDISGEHAHLDSARFGIGLNLALMGLKKNESLKVLKIQHQNLGLQGANTLAEVLEENHCLVEIHCESNEINLQSFSVLVNALEKNTTLLYMPALDHDREVSLDKVRRELDGTSKAQDSSGSGGAHALRRTLMGSMGSKSHRSSLSASSPVSWVSPYTEQDVKAVMAALNEKWDAEVTRMQHYLTRNYHLAQGLPWDEPLVTAEQERPLTGELVGEMMEQLQVEQTPRVEKAREDPEYTDLHDRLVPRRSYAAFSLPEE